MDFTTQLGLIKNCVLRPRRRSPQYANLKLTSIGQPTFYGVGDSGFTSLSKTLLASYQENHASWLTTFLPATNECRASSQIISRSRPKRVPHLPNNTLVLDRHGVARTLSLPAKGDYFSSEIIDSYRIQQGILHNQRATAARPRRLSRHRRGTSYPQ